MQPKLRNWLILIVTIGHFGLSIFLNLEAFSIVMAKIDSPEPLTISEKLITATGIILIQPLLFLVMGIPGLPRMLSGFLGYLLYIVNSMLWAIILVVLVGKMYELLERRKSKEVIQPPSFDDRKER